MDLPSIAPWIQNTHTHTQAALEQQQGVGREREIGGGRGVAVHVLAMERDDFSGFHSRSQCREERRAVGAPSRGRGKEEEAWRNGTVE